MGLRAVMVLLAVLWRKARCPQSCVRGPASPRRGFSRGLGAVQAARVLWPLRLMEVTDRSGLLVVAAGPSVPVVASPSPLRVLGVWWALGWVHMGDKQLHTAPPSQLGL